MSEVLVYIAAKSVPMPTYPRISNYALALDQLAGPSRSRPVLRCGTLKLRRAGLLLANVPGIKES